MNQLDHVRTATVRLPEMGGRGVLVSGGFIATAMHCFGWDGTAGWVLGDHHPVLIETPDCQFRLGPWFADAVSDMAVLGPLDNQVFPEDEDTFERWRERTSPVALSPWTPSPRSLMRSEPESLPVQLLSLEREWFGGSLDYWGTSPFPQAAALTAVRSIEAGMSGGPVVDQQGQLVGVVSWGNKEGSIPLATMTLPGWILGRIKAASSTEEVMA
jgi:hypothetical protein